MKTTKTLITLASVIFSMTPCLSAVEFDSNGATPGKWTMDLDAAKKVAVEKQLPILLDFSGSDWCGWCKIMEENVFTKPEWQSYAQENLVMVLLDYPRDKSLVPEKYVERNKALKSKYGVTGYPTFVILDDDGETELGRLGSGRDKTPESFQEELQNLFRSLAAEIGKIIAKLSPDDQTAYRALIDQLATEKMELKKAEKASADARGKVSKLKSSVLSVENKIRTFRVAQLDDAERRQYDQLTEKLKEAKQEVSDWIQTKPKQNEENMAKYKSMQAEIQEIEKQLAQY